MPLHPFLSQMLEALAGVPALSAGTPEQGRQLIAASRSRIGSGPEMSVRRDFTLEAPGRAIPLRLLIPEGEVQGTVIYLHGGGWVLGAPDDFDTLAATLADRSGAAVLLVDYRLAPEHPFPAGLEDCREVLQAALERRIPGLPDGGVVVAGDSAGGNLATVCCAGWQGGEGPCLQVLLYPVTDCDFSRSSYSRRGTGLPLTAADMKWFFEAYAPEGNWSRPEISPLQSASAGVPAVIVTAEYDVLADEGRAYARALRDRGGRVTHRHAEDLTHGFIRLHNLLPPADEELNRISAEIRSALRG